MLKLSPTAEAFGEGHDTSVSWKATAQNPKQAMSAIALATAGGPNYYFTFYLNKVQTLSTLAVATSGVRNNCVRHSFSDGEPFIQ